MARDVQRLMSPQTIAVVGGGAWCANVVISARKFGFEGQIWPVHPYRDTVAGLPAVASVQDLPGAPDATFVGVNHAATVGVIAALSAMGAGGAVAFASGFSEVEDPNAQNRQARLVDAAGEMPVIGPNCYGFINALDRTALWPDQHGLAHVDRGVAILTQSSNIAINLTMQTRGLPIGCVITVGNQAQMGLADLGERMLADDRITALGLHIEGIGDVRAFERMANSARNLGKQIVVLKAGASDAAQIATVSHTASLAGSSAGASALFHRLGCAEVEGLGAFLETLKMLHVVGPLPSGAIASMSCSGGEASLIADTVHRKPALHWPDLTPRQTTALATALGPRVTLANPLDYHTYVWNDADQMAQVYAAMMDGPQELTVLIADFPRSDRADAADWDCVITAAKKARRMTGKRLAVLATLPETMSEQVVAELAKAGIVAFCGLEDGVSAIDLAARIQPPIAEPVLLAPLARDVRVLGEDVGKAWLSSHGIAVPKQVTVQGPQQVADAVTALTFPLVAKGLGLAHKSEAGAVVLNLCSADDVACAVHDIQATSYLIEEQIVGGIAELLVGILRDPAHGFVLTLGAGGVLTEIMQDVVSLLVPASRDQVDASLDQLAIAPILRGYRGKPAVARDALLDTVMALQAAVIAEAPCLEEVEINPLIVTEHAAIAVDALIRRGEPE